MNRGLNFYSIILVTITTLLVFSLNNFGVVHATTGIDLDNNLAQSNQIPDLKSDPNDNEESPSNNNNNDDPNNDDTNNDKSTSTSTTSTSTSTTTTTSNDNVPMSLPFNSNMANESDDEKDYSSIIPFP